jgi:SAM-dependent methyltransferase
MNNQIVTDRYQQYFSEIAPKLDWWQRRNRYYYQDIEKLHKFIITPDSNVLEIGCGTGDLLASTQPKIGVGIDFAEAIVDIALNKYPHLKFYCLDAQNLTPDVIKEHPLSTIKFDYIILSGVLGYLTDIQNVLQNLHQFTHPKTRIIISFHNYLWEPILNLAQILKQRHPQPPQNWLSMTDVNNLINITGYQSIYQGRRFLVPKNIPLISNFINRYCAKLPIIKHLCLTNYIIARPAYYNEQQVVKDYSVSVIIPARNEAGNIQSAIDRLPLLGKHTEVIFVEGHSSDDTWDKIQTTITNYQGDYTIKSYQQTGKGKGDAVRLGFGKATGDILIILDADLTVQPEDLPKFVEVIAINRGEFINGSRLVYPYSNTAMPWLNTMANKFFALVFSYLLDQTIKDTLCGTKVLWRSDYELIAKNRHYFGDFDPFGDFDLLFGASKIQRQIVEVPVRYQPRVYGSSNIAHFREGLVLLKMCLYAARKIKFIP